MPNWCTNVLSIEECYKSHVLNDKGEVDFGILVPMPESLNVTSGSITDEAIAVYKYRQFGNIDPIRSMMFKRNVNSNIEDYVKQLEKEYVNLKADRATAYEKEHCKTLADLGKTYVDNEYKYGFATWYDWCCKNWGTKWNACDTYNSVGGTVSFSTAWAPPTAWLKVLAERKIPFILEWEEEGGYAGTISFDGKKWNEETHMIEYEEEE